MSEENKYVIMSLDEIQEPDQAMRQFFDENKLYELANSIKELGVIEPIILRKTDKGYEIVAGHRRYVASKMAQLATIPAIITTDGEEIIHAKRLHENLIREDVNPYDIAVYLKKLKEEKLLSHQAIADMFSRSVSWVSMHLSILDMDPEIQQAVEQGRVSYQVGLEIMKVKSPEKRFFLLDQVLVGDASFRIVKGWVCSALIEEGSRPAAQSIQMQPGALAEIQKLVMNCACCDRSCDTNTMINFWVDSACYVDIMNFFKAWRMQNNERTDNNQNPG